MSARPDGIGGAIITGDPGSSGELRPAVLEGLCARRRRSASTAGCSIRCCGAPTAVTRASTGTPRSSTVADGFRRVVERDGPDAVAFYLSGQLLTEDYYVANKLMKGFLGSANVDTNSRLCMASTVAGHRRAFGDDMVPGCYEDLDQADLIVLVGSNTAWCHPVLFQRMIAQPARPRRQDRRDRPAADGDRRATPICSCRSRRAPTPRCFADCWCISPSSARSIDAYIDGTYRANSRCALSRAREIAPGLAATAAATGLDEGDVARFFDLFRANERTVTCFSQGVNQSAQGTDKVNAIINCHLATGRIGKPGMGPFSLTGQPNAMGGREVGGLANQLAAHMGFAPDEVDRVRRFWNAPRMAEREGLKAVQMFEAIERGEIKALWVMATNPAVSLPRAGAMREALEKARTVRRLREHAGQRHRVGCAARSAARRRLGREGRHRHQLRAAHLAPARLPAAAGRGPAGLVDRRRGGAAAWAFGDAFAYRSAADMFREHAALSAFENDGAREFDHRRAGGDLGRGLRRARAGAMAGAGGGGEPTRLFADGGFFTADRKARFVAPEPPALREADERRISVAAQHRPAARSVAQHDALGPEPEARRAPAGAVPGDPSARRQGARAVEQRLRPCRNAARRLHRSRW